MHYSLFSRFQGCLLGAILGEWLQGDKAKLADRSLVQAAGTLALRNTGAQIYHWQPEGATPELLIGSQLAIAVAEALIRSSRWDQEKNGLPGVSSLPKEGLTEGALAIATLPISLFFHDELPLQQEHLRHTIQTWGGNSAQVSRVMLFGYAIAQILKAQLQPSTFLAQAQAYLRISGDPSSELAALIQDLHLADTQMNQGIDLKRLAAQLASASPPELGSSHAGPPPILVALCAFLSTPEAFRLSLVRSLQVGDRATMVSSLIGAISGAYNSSAGIPATWLHSAYSSHPDSTLAQIRHLSARLFTCWSGSDPTYVLKGHITAVSAPWSTRSR